MSNPKQLVQGAINKLKEAATAGENAVDSLMALLMIVPEELVDSTINESSKILGNIYDEQMEQWDPKVEAESSYRSRLKGKLTETVMKSRSRIENAVYHAVHHAAVSCKEKLMEYLAGNFLEKQLEAVLNEEVIIQQALGITEAEMEELFTLAKGMITEDIELASGLFGFLIYLNPELYEPYIGLASTFIVEELYDEAESAFMQAISVGRGNPRPYYYYARYLLDRKGENGSKEKGLQVVNSALSLCEGNEKYGSLKENFEKLKGKFEGMISPA